MHRTSQVKLQMRTAPIARGRPNLEHSTLSSNKYPQLLRVCQVTEGLSLHFPSTDHLLIVPYALGRWTQRDSNPHLPLGQSAVLPWALRPSSASTERFARTTRTNSRRQVQNGNLQVALKTNILFLTTGARVSHAVLNTNRGARPRILIRYGTARFASNFAVSRNSHPSPFCTMSSLSPSSKSDNFTTSGKNIFARAPRINATHAARRCQRSGDFAQRNTDFVRAAFATTIGPIR
jgi:hypothetical protein